MVEKVELILTPKANPTMKSANFAWPSCANSPNILEPTPTYQLEISACPHVKLVGYSVPTVPRRINGREFLLERVEAGVVLRLDLKLLALVWFMFVPSPHMT